MKEFHDLGDFQIEEVDALIELAGRLEKNPEPQALAGKVLALLFLSPSLRTLASFQAAMTRLGGGSFVISPNMSIHGLETRSGIVMDGQAAEHIREAVPVIASYGDAIGIRAFAQRETLPEHRCWPGNGAGRRWREAAVVPVSSGPCRMRFACSVTRCCALLPRPSMT